VEQKTIDEEHAPVLFSAGIFLTIFMVKIKKWNKNM
jgi:hypothetical protein